VQKVTRAFPGETIMQVVAKLNVECEDVSASLGDFIDNELPIELSKAFESHISSCQYCRRNYNSYVETIRLARQIPEKKITVEQENKLRSGLNKRLGINLPLR
jgi:anti-sigma factor RsiW